MIKRALALGTVLGACLVSAEASADEPAPSATDPSAAPSETSTTSVTSAEPTAPPYAPAEPSCGLVNRSCKGAHLALAIEGGASSYNESSPFSFNTGTGSVSASGPSWGLRVGVELSKWLAFDAHYMGTNNHANGVATPNGSVSLLTSTATGEARFTAPIPYVQPYLLLGAGLYSTSVTGSNTARAASPLTGSTEFGVPVGVGLSIPISNGVSAGAELTYHRLFGESFSKDEEFGGGDLTTMNAVIRARL